MSGGPVASATDAANSEKGSRSARHSPRAPLLAAAASAERTEAVEVDHAGPTDRDLLQAAREGKEEAARRLLVEDAPTMLRTAWHVLGRYGGSEVEDVVQEAFLAALTTTALPRGRPRGEASLDRGEKGPRSDTQGEVAQ